MGRPKIKTIETAIDLEKVKLPEEEIVPVLDEKAEEVLAKSSKEKLAAGKKTAKTSVAKIPHQHSKRYLESLKLIDKSKGYYLSEAVELVKKTSTTKFDATIEAHVNLRSDPAKQDQQIRTTVTLPHGSGKKVKILVFGASHPKDLKETESEAGDEETLNKIAKGKLDFDKVVATPEWMPKLAKVARILGPKGLMPNPKSGTVTNDPEKTMKELSSGLVEIKTEISPIIHVSVGKVSFSNKNLEENIKSLVASIKDVKPAEIKKELVKDVYLSSSMGPSLKLDLSSLN